MSDETASQKAVLCWWCNRMGSKRAATALIRNPFGRLTPLCQNHLTTTKNTVGVSWVKRDFDITYSVIELSEESIAEYERQVEAGWESGSAPAALVQQVGGTDEDPVRSQS